MRMVTVLLCAAMLAEIFSLHVADVYGQIAMEANHAENVAEPIKADIFFTRGKRGPLHTDEYFIGEDPDILIWMNGIKSRSEDKGVGHIKGILRLLGEDGSVISELEVHDRAFREVLGQGVVVFTATADIFGKRKHGSFSNISWTATHVESGRPITGTRRITWNEVNKLTVIQHRIKDLREPEWEIGSPMQAGRDYSIHFKVSKCSVIKSQARVRISLNAFDASGNPISAALPQKDGVVSVIEGREDELVVEIDVPFQPNRAGSYIIRAIVEDLNSGEKATHDIPIVVESPFSSPGSAALGQLDIDLQLTQGEFGSVRSDSIYFENETIHAAARIVGLNRDNTSKGNLSFDALLVDESGRTLLRKKLGPFSYEQCLGGNSLVFPFSLETNYASGIPQRLRLSLAVTDLVTGATGTADQEIVANPDNELHTTGHWISLDEEGKVPAGSTLHVCQVYYLRGTVVGFTPRNFTVDLDLSLRGVDLSGNALSPLEMTSTHSQKLSRYSDPPKSAQFYQIFGLNRSGEFALRVMVKDKHSGKTATTDLPITVIPPNVNTKD